MVTAIVGAITMIGSLIYRFAVDYISNIIVTTLVFPAQVLEAGNKTMGMLLKPLTV